MTIQAQAIRWPGKKMYDAHGETRLALSKARIARAAQMIMLAAIGS